nr:DUF3347 domain-containing protein [uncultured Fluviicola sp.]
MKRFNWLWSLLLLVSFTSCAGSVKNAKTETFKVAGNCDMCKNTIETAVYRKGIAEAEWNKETKLLELTYDSQKTSSDEVLKRIAYAGYDNENYLAPDEAYAKLPSCCHYDRMKKETVVQEAVSEKTLKEETVQEPGTAKSKLTEVYSAYFTTKDALVKDDATAASAKATILAKAIGEVDMKAMSTEEHGTWMKVEKELLAEAKRISTTKKIEDQRAYFSSLSKDVYSLMKVFKSDETVYLQHCPMYNDGAGADWLSKESAVKNPYYGSSMLTCGKTTETIK